jgi:hypothetical protein
MSSPGGNIRSSRSKSAHFDIYEEIIEDSDERDDDVRDQTDHQRFASMVEPRRRRSHGHIDSLDAMSPDRMSEPNGVFRRTRLHRSRSGTFRNLEEKKERINSMFGFLPFKV